MEIFFRDNVRLIFKIGDLLVWGILGTLPGIANGVKGYGWTYTSGFRRNLKNGLAFLEKGLRCSRTDEEVWFSKHARVLFLLGLRKEAIEACRKYLVRFPNNESLLTTLFGVLDPKETEEFEEWRRCGERLAEMNPYPETIRAALLSYSPEDVRSMMAASPASEHDNWEVGDTL